MAILVELLLFGVTVVVTVVVAVVVVVTLLANLTRVEFRLNAPPSVQQELESPQHQEPSPHDVTRFVQFDGSPGYQVVTINIGLEDIEQ
jgi:hypothetical protein